MVCCFSNILQTGILHTKGKGVRGSVQKNAEIRLKMAAMFSLRDDANLREFVLENVEHFGEERVLGTGSYGSVQEVSHCMLCFCALSLVYLLAIQV